MRGFPAITAAADGCRVRSSRGLGRRLLSGSAEAAPVAPGTAIADGATVAPRWSRVWAGAAVMTGAAVTARATLITREAPSRRLTEHVVTLNVAGRAAVQPLEDTLALTLADLVY